MKKRWQWNPYQVVILVALLAALLGAYYLPPDARGELRADAGYVWGALASLFGPLVRRKILEATEGEL